MGLIAFLDSAGIPLPAGADALLIAISAASPLRAWMAASLATAGSLLGFLVLYFIARKGGELYLDKHTSSGKGRKLRAWFQRYGLAAVFVPTLSPVPLPTKVFVICAGAMGVRVIPFALAVLGARLIRYFGLAYLGSRLGAGSHAWLKTHALTIALAALGLFLAAALVARLAARNGGGVNGAPSS